MGQVKLWRLSDWRRAMALPLPSTYTISGFRVRADAVTLGLRLNGSSLSVEVDGVTRITATDSTFSTGEVGLWSYQPTAANQHLFDDFLVQNLGQGYIPGSKVRAAENAPGEGSARGNGELRKAQLLQAPPAGHAWTSYYFAGSARIAMRVQVNGTADQVYYLLTDHLGSTAITVGTNNSKVAEIRYKPWGETRHVWGTTPTDYRFTGQRERKKG